MWPLALQLELDASGAVPLYRQLADALRHRVSSGVLLPGTRLPPVREGAALWGVNLHTVRRAYLTLQALGVVQVRRPQGTFVSPSSGGVDGDPITDFALGVLEEARGRFGLTHGDFLRLLTGLGPSEGPRAIHVVECSRTLSDSLARQVRGRCGGEVRAWRTTELAEIGEGLVVGTYFHFNQIRAAFAPRMAEVHFVSIAPAKDALRPSLIEASARGCSRVRLCERDASMARAVAADTAPEAAAVGVEIQVEVPVAPADLLDGEGPVLFSPGSWDTLGDAERRHGDAFLLDYAIAPEDLEALAELASV